MNEARSQAYLTLIETLLTCPSEEETAILQAITIKPERHEFREQPAKLMRFMSMTGG